MNHKSFRHFSGVRHDDLSKVDDMRLQYEVTKASRKDCYCDGFDS